MRPADLQTDWRLQLPGGLVMPADLQREAATARGLGGAGRLPGGGILVATRRGLERVIFKPGASETQPGARHRRRRSLEHVICRPGGQRDAAWSASSAGLMRAPRGGPTTLLSWRRHNRAVLHAHSLDHAGLMRAPDCGPISLMSHTDSNKAAQAHEP